MNQTTIEDIDTDTGNTILDTLKAEGWKVVSQYNPLAFDKGIDFDSYRLKQNGVELNFEWDNWFEWKISGPEPVIAELAIRFTLKNK